MWKSCKACRKWFENWSWPFSLILDGFPRPVITSFCPIVSQPVGGRSMFCKKCTWPTTLPSFSTATACQWKEFSSFTAQQSFVDLSTRIHGRGEGRPRSSASRPTAVEATDAGGLTARRKRESSLLYPPPLFPGSRSQKGGHNSGTVQYHSRVARVQVRTPEKSFLAETRLICER